jgi:hypothetical protein
VLSLFDGIVGAHLHLQRRRRCQLKHMLRSRCNTSDSDSFHSPSNSCAGASLPLQRLRRCQLHDMVRSRRNSPSNSCVRQDVIHPKQSPPTIHRTQNSPARCRAVQQHGSGSFFPRGSQVVVLSRSGPRTRPPRPGQTAPSTTLIRPTDRAYHRACDRAAAAQPPPKPLTRWDPDWRVGRAISNSRHSPAETTPPSRRAPEPPAHAPGPHWEPAPRRYNISSPSSVH